MTLEPLWITTLPLDFTSSVTLAVTWSPGLHFLASRGLVSSVCMVLPSLSRAEAPAVPAALPEALLPPRTPVLESCSDLRSCDASALPATPAPVEAPGACVFWLALAPAEAWPGETEALADPEAEVPAVCAAAASAKTATTKMLVQICFIWAPLRALKFFGLDLTPKWALRNLSLDAKGPKNVYSYQHNYLFTKGLNCI